jgi:hypothetical protein
MAEVLCTGGLCEGICGRGPVAWRAEARDVIVGHVSVAAGDKALVVGQHGRCSQLFICRAPLAGLWTECLGGRQAS